MSLSQAHIRILDPAAAAHTPAGRAAATHTHVRDIIRAAGTPPPAALQQLNRLVRSGHARATLSCAHPDLRTAAGNDEQARTLCRRNPDLWNIFAYEREWDSHPEYNNFMDPASPVHQRKTFQAEIYARLLAQPLEGLAADSRVLDAGAGVGRMVPHLAPYDARLDLVDASERALLHAWDALCRTRAAAYDLHWRDARDLGCFEDNAFDLVRALELLCYMQDPWRAAAELGRVCRPGGTVAFSVENKAGAMLADPLLASEDADHLLKSNELVVPEYLYVSYHTAEAAAALAVMAGLQIRRVAGCHFLADGPFHTVVDEALLADPARRARALAAEDMCREHPWLRRLARAWFVIAEKPGPAT